MGPEAERILEDGVAGTEAPSRFLAEVRAAGPDANSSVQATLLVDGVEVASQVIDVASGQTRELEFVHQFDVPGAPAPVRRSAIR